MDDATRFSEFAGEPPARPVPPPIIIGAGARRIDPPSEPASVALSGRWIGLLACLTIIAIAPYLIGKIVYEVRYAELKAGADVATGTLAGLKGHLSDFEMTSRMVAKRLAPSVVSIIRPSDDGHEGLGSGVIVDTAGFIITSNHVVTGATSIEVQLSDGRRTNATIAGADDMTDLALLKIDMPNLTAAEWGDSDELEVGDLVWALGSPFGLDRSFTFGIVSAKSRRSANWLTRNPYQEYLQTDVAVNPGNSGGPLININGQIVGINAAIFGNSYQGISFAVPSNVAHDEYTQLRAKGWIERAYLGIRPTSVPEDVRERLGLESGEGVFVEFVEPKAPAARAGIHDGDVILRWNDQIALNPALLSRTIAATKIGSTAKVQLVRADTHAAGAKPTRNELEVTVQVERHPDFARPASARQ